jgi:hypothetical protein
VCLSLCLAICLGWFPALAGKPAGKHTLDFTVIETGNAPGYPRDPTVRLFEAVPDFQSFYRRVHSGRVPPPEAPHVHTEENLVLYVSYGEKPTAGYSVQVREVFTRKDLVVVQAILLTPPENSFQAQVITHPYVLLSVEEDAVQREDVRRIELRNDRGEVLARDLVHN